MLNLISIYFLFLLLNSHVVLKVFDHLISTMISKIIVVVTLTQSGDNEHAIDKACESNKERFTELWVRRDALNVSI